MGEPILGRNFSFYRFAEISLRYEFASFSLSLPKALALPWEDYQLPNLKLQPEYQKNLVHN